MGNHVDRSFVPEEFEPPPCTCGQPDRVHTSGCAITNHYRRCVLSVQGLLHAPVVAQRTWLYRALGWFG